MPGQAPATYYDASAPAAAARPRLHGEMRADVCVIGGGYTGLSAALHLAEQGAKVVLVEAQTIGAGASGRNGGQIHTGLRKDQAELERWLGPIHARDLWNLAEEAKATLRDLVQRHEIACGLKSGLVIAAHNHGALCDLADDTAHLSKAYGYADARMMDAQETVRQLGTAVYPGGRFDSGGGHLQPLSYARGLAAAAEKAGANLFEFSPAVRVETQQSNVRVTCADGVILADQIVLACDSYSASVVPALARYIAHVESFIVATEPLDEDLRRKILPCDVAVADTRHVLDYYRKSEDGRMLFAGRESYLRPPKNIPALVRPRMARVFPELENSPIAYGWSGTVGITRTRMPHFGRLGARLLFAHGYSGQGVALATLGGKLMAEAILGRPEKFETFTRVPAQAFPGGALLRKPLVTAALMWFKLVDAI